MRFDRKKFFEGLRKWQGPLTPQQVAGLTFILDAAERDRFLIYTEWLAYMLATVKHETANTFQPIHEYGGRNYFIRRYGGQTALGKRLGNDTPEEGADYAGEGDVQLTGESNYEKAEKALREQYPDIVADFEKRTGRFFDLTVGDQPNDKDDPKNAGDPAIAYAIMSYGMRTGMFTGRRLTIRTDYKEWRRIINGTDHAALIAGYAVKFEKILRDSAIAEADGEITDESTADASRSEEPDPSLAGSTSDTQATTAADAQSSTSLPPRLSMWERLTGWQEKVDKVTSFQNSLSPISGSSKFTVLLTKFGGWLIMLLGLVADHWIWIAAGVVLVGLAVWYLSRSKDRAAGRSGNAPAEQSQTQTVVVKK